MQQEDTKTTRQGVADLDAKKIVPKTHAGHRCRHWKPTFENGETFYLCVVCSAPWLNASH